MDKWSSKQRGEVVVALAEKIRLRNIAAGVGRGPELPAPAPDPFAMSDSDAEIADPYGVVDSDADEAAEEGEEAAEEGEEAAEEAAAEEEAAEEAAEEEAEEEAAEDDAADEEEAAAEDEAAEEEAQEGEEAPPSSPLPAAAAELASPSPSVATPGSVKDLMKLTNKQVEGLTIAKLKEVCNFYGVKYGSDDLKSMFVRKVQDIRKRIREAGSTHPAKGGAAFFSAGR